MSTEPADMNFDVREELCVTQQNAATAADIDAKSGTKRRRIMDPIPPKPPAPPTIIDVSAIYGQNYFGILGDLDIECTPTDPIQPKPYKVNVANKTEKPSIRKSFCPPIFLYNVNVKHFVDQLKSKTPPITFEVRNVNKTKSKLYLADHRVHADMMKLLREKNIPAYSFTPKEFKQESLILRGLYHGCEESEVKDEFDQIVPDCVSKVTKYTTKFSLKNNLDTGLYLVTLLPGKKLSDVANIKSVLSQKVTWEKPKRKNQELQCHRCQKWGHVGKNCTAEFKCVKCDKKHSPGECLRVATDDSVPFCVNCNEAGHPASWRGCPSFKMFSKARKDKIMKARMEKITAANNVTRAVNASYRTTGKSFAQLFQAPQNLLSTHEKKSSIIEDFLRLTEFFMQPEEMSLEDEIAIFMRDYNKMPKQDAKKEFLRLLNKVRNHGP